MGVATDNKKSILSKREVEILQAVAKGLSNQEIANELVISVNTVRVHLRNIFEKLQVQSRTEATMWAIQQGVIATETPETENDSDTDHPLVSRAPILIPHLSAWQRLYFVMAIIVAAFVLITPVVKSMLKQPLSDPIAPPKTNSISTQESAGGWSTMAKMPAARTHLALAVYQDELYIIGGYQANGITGVVDIFNPKMLTWREAADKPTPVANIQGVVIGDYIYVAGGCTNTTEVTNVLEILNPIENVWRVGAPLPEPLCAYAATAYDEKLYLIGGWNGSAYVDMVYVYDPSLDQWQLMGQHYPLKVGFAAAATLDDKIYVAGGYDGDEEYADVNIFSPATDEWVNGVSLKQPRGGLALVAVGRNLYAMGGGLTTFLTTNEQLLLDQAEWREWEVPFYDEWRNFGAAVIEPNIFSVGGWNGEYLDSIIYHRTTPFKLFLPVVQ
jgi:DNA-binding CsgD family transcriptional regulator/N-acetylneuraminic acid mutarotase